MINTSISNPLRIDAVEIQSSKGIIGMTFCPGIKQNHGASGSHNRDLDLDLAAIQAWGAEILVSLMEPHEYALLGVEALHDKVPEGMLHLQLPIPDGSIPDAAWEATWKRKSPFIHTVLRRGGKVCLHCLGGLGRTGLVAARLLVEFGVLPEEAILMVRKARAGTIETMAQEAYVWSLAPPEDVPYSKE